MSQIKTNFNFGKLLKVLIAILTALAGSIGVASCTAKRETHPSPPCEGGSTVIAENVIPCYYENALPLHDV